MENLIKTINFLHKHKREYDFMELEIPQIIVVGSQSSGKSSVLERIIGCDILPKGSTLATRCPIIIKMINDLSEPDIYGFINNESEKLNGAFELSKKLNNLTDEINKDGVAHVTSDPIEIQLYGSKLPTLTMVDLPGIIKNDGIMQQGSKETILQLSERYSERNLSIILAVSSANVDLANSDSIQIAQKFDPQGIRTIHVLTKVDLMDKGTNVRSMIKSEYLTNCIAKICLVNRSQQKVTDNQCIKLTKDEERQFFDTEYNDISSEHGIDVLTEKLILNLSKKIDETLPVMCMAVSNKLKSITDFIKDNKIECEPRIIRNIVREFVEKYNDLLLGFKPHDGDTVEGGAKISLALYVDFSNHVKAMKTNYLTIERISNTIINCSGKCKISYSLEEPFKQLIRKEIEQFKSPCIDFIDKLQVLLIRFVADVIKELKIQRFVALAPRIEKEMEHHIGRQYNKTKEYLMNFVRFEANDVFCTHPNSYFFDNVAGKIKGLNNQGENNPKQQICDENIIESMVKYGFQFTMDHLFYVSSKCIQTLLIDDLLDAIKKDLAEDIGIDAEELMMLDPELDWKLQNAEKESKDLKVILDKLWKLRR